MCVAVSPTPPLGWAVGHSTIKNLSGVMDPESMGGDVGNYNYDNVFNITEQDKTPGSSENLVLMKTHDLFKEYVFMTHDEVTWSNKWYLTWTAEI
jgi:hypothetical protein